MYTYDSLYDRPLFLISINLSIKRCFRSYFPHLDAYHQLLGQTLGLFVLNSTRDGHSLLPENGPMNKLWEDQLCDFEHSHAYITPVILSWRGVESFVQRRHSR